MKAEPSIPIGETIALWRKINAYASACGGDTSGATLGVAREQAVATIEYELADLVDRRVAAALQKASAEARPGVLRTIRQAASDVAHAANAKLLLAVMERVLRGATNQQSEIEDCQRCGSPVILSTISAARSVECADCGTERRPVPFKKGAMP